MIPRLSAGQRIAALERLHITDHTTGERSHWRLNAAQKKIIRALASHPYVFATKPRQVGATTVVTGDDVVSVALADGVGHIVRCGIVVDTDEKTRERMKLVADFCEQWELGCSSNAVRTVFPNGSEIVGMTAGGSRAGASTTFQRLHLSELPYWPDPVETYAALMPALAPGGTCVIETTMDTRTSLARDLWRGDNAYHKVFFPVEEHDEYRADPSKLTPDQIAWLTKEGFTRQDSMAWWIWALENLCGGDVVRCMREFPQREEHMFQASEERWIRATPKVLEPIEVLRVRGFAGDDWPAYVYQTPDSTSGDLMIGVDTATGKERDRSVVAVVDRVSRRMAACLVSDKIYGDDLARAAKRLQEHYTKDNRPIAYVEDNGIGEMTVQQCDRLNVAYERVTTTEDTRYRGLLEAKRAVEAGYLEGPAELADECDELHRDDLGRFKGRKDILMAYGFCATRISDAPVVAGPAEDKSDENRIRARKLLRAQMKRSMMGGW
jgi:hypothetical protein